MSLLDILACPICKADLEQVESHLRCLKCGKEYPILEGVPVMLPDWETSDIRHEGELILREGYNPWIEQMIMQSLTDDQIVVDAGCGNMALDDPCLIRMDVTLTPYVDVVGDLHALPFKPSSLDFIFALAVFEHLRQPFLAAQEIFNALKPGGYTYAECNFIFAYHGYPHHYFNASIHGLQQIFAPFRQLRLGVAPYQMPSFALENIVGSYLGSFKASNLTELAFETLARSLLLFPLQDYDYKFGPEAAFRTAAGDYFVGLKQPNGAETILPAAVMKVYARDPALQSRYPDPYDLAAPDNLMTWAKLEGQERYPEIRDALQGVRPFSKYLDSSRPLARKIHYRSDIADPSQQRIEKSRGGPSPFGKILRMVFGKLAGKIKSLGFLGLVKRMWVYLRGT